MVEMTSQQMAGKLLAAGFERSGPSTSALSDPIADTPMVVTLDQLRPYDHDPRKKRNPAYEDIKASIRERGLDAAPAITRRPARATTSSATAATHAWRSCANCGRRPRTSGSSAYRACSGPGPAAAKS